MIKHITFDRSQYEIWPDFWEDVNDLTRLLTNLGYVITARWDGGCKGEDGIFVIEFDYEDPELADHYNRWLTGEELDLLESYQANLSD